jgi:hypothetical protein
MRTQDAVRSRCADRSENSCGDVSASDLLAKPTVDMTKKKWRCPPCNVLSHLGASQGQALGLVDCQDDEDF